MFGKLRRGVLHVVGRDVERALGHPIAQTIDYAPSQVTESLNRGVPLLQEYRDSPAARDIFRLAQQIVGGEAMPERTVERAKQVPTNNEKPKRRGIFFRGQSASADKVKA